jgi:uncharacterized cupin superfamily protein
MSIAKTTVVILLAGAVLTALAEGSPPASASKSVVRFAGADLTSLLQSPTAVKKTTEIRTTTSVPMFKSDDQKFSSGVFSSTAGYVEFDSYAADEFCYIVSGEATLTAADGTVTKLAAGDAITVPKGWKGRWDTSGYTKYFVSYRSAR